MGNGAEVLARETYGVIGTDKTYVFSLEIFALLKVYLDVHIFCRMGI